MSSGLPFSRAPGSRRDNRILGEEDRAARAREIPARDNWYICSVPYGSAIGDRTGLTANLLRFYYLGKMELKTSIAKARIDITTASAGQDVRSAIYVYDTSKPARRLIKMPGSEAVFSASTTGLKDISLPDGTEVSVGQMFLGVKASDNFLGVAGLAATVFNRVVPIYTFLDAAGALPLSVDFNLLTKNYIGIILAVLYMSPDAVQVL